MDNTTFGMTMLVVGMGGTLLILWLLSLLIGGLAALTKATGGLDWLAGAIARFARGHRGRRTGELLTSVHDGISASRANNASRAGQTGHERHILRRSKIDSGRS